MFPFYKCCWDSGGVEDGLEEASLEPRRLRGGDCSGPGERWWGLGHGMAVRVPNPLAKPVNIRVRWLLWKHQMFPFLSEQGGLGTDQQLGFYRHEGGLGLP